VIFPIEVDKLRQVPRRRLIIINEIRSIIIKKHNATIDRSITIGIFGWIATNAVEEVCREVRRDMTPYWRTLKGRWHNKPKIFWRSLEAENSKGKEVFCFRLRRKIAIFV